MECGCIISYLFIYLLYIKKTYVRVLCLELAVSGVTFYNILFKFCTIARENQCHWQTLSQYVVSSAPHHEWEYDM